MRSSRCGAILAAALFPMTTSACGQSHQRPPLRDPAEAVRVLKRQGYQPARHFPLPRPSAHSDLRGGVVLVFRFDTRYGQPVGEYEKDGLHVTVVRGDSHKRRVPDTYWYRSGDTIVFAWPHEAQQRAQFLALVEAL
jgi:hypothetical protein